MVQPGHDPWAGLMVSYTGFSNCGGCVEQDEHWAEDDHEYAEGLMRYNARQLKIMFNLVEAE